MSARAVLVAGTALSLAVTDLWSLSATATIGPAPLPRLSRNLPADYTALAAAATGSTWTALFGVTAAAYALCFLASGLRARRRALREAAQDPGHDENEYAEAIPVPAGRQW